LRVCGKGRKERLVWLSADAYAVLQTWLEMRPPSDHAQVFLNERGQPLCANGMQWLLHRYGRQIDLDLTPHQLRHTFARQLTEAGMPLTSLGKLLGHAQITTTQIYTAGADPGLAQAYQEAMQRLNDAPKRPPPEPPSLCEAQLPSPQPPPLPTPAAASEPAALPNWDDWEPDWPPAIRQACLDYVRRRFFCWNAKRRLKRARQVLNELRRVWEWFLARRPLIHPGQLRYPDLLAYQSAHLAQGHSPATINRRLDFMMGILRDLADRDEPVDNSVFRLRGLPRPVSLPRHLSEAESQRLEAFLHARLASSDPRIRLENACLWVLLHSGLRAAECVDLHFGDLDLAAKRLIVRQGKGQRDRLVYLSEVTCQALEHYLQGASRRPSEPLWLHPNGKPISDPWLRSHVRAIGKALAIEPLFPHRLRHTLATRLLNAGMEITRIQKLLGHEWLTTTMIYARVHDATVEADYRRAIRQIEYQHMPLSGKWIEVSNWPTQIVNVQENLDNSV